jgi:hypothetical protein
VRKSAGATRSYAKDVDNQKDEKPKLECRGEYHDAAFDADDGELNHDHRPALHCTKPSQPRHLPAPP